MTDCHLESGGDESVNEMWEVRHELSYFVSHLNSEGKIVFISTEMACLGKVNFCVVVQK